MKFMDRKNENCPHGIEQYAAVVFDNFTSNSGVKAVSQ